MPEVRFTIDQDYLQQLQELLREPKSTEVTRSALTLLNWAAEEVSKGRVIFSAAPDGAEVKRLALPALDRVRADAAQSSRAANQASRYMAR